VIRRINVTKATSGMPFPSPGSNDGPQMNSTTLTGILVMSTGMRVMMVTVGIQIRRKMHLKPMMDQYRMWRTEGMALESVKIARYI
jgi:hypothetical protein